MKANIPISERIKKQGSTIVLRFAVIGAGMIALGLAALVLPAILRGWDRDYPSLMHLKYPVFMLLSLSLLPFYFALYQTMKLLDLIDASKAFSQKSVIALRKIKYCAAMFAGLFVLCLPIVYSVAQVEDAPGLIIVSTITMVGAPLVVAVFATVLERLLKNAIEIKTENEYTV